MIVRGTSVIEYLVIEGNVGQPGNEKIVIDWGVVTPNGRLSGPASRMLLLEH